MAAVRPRHDSGGDSPPAADPPDGRAGGGERRRVGSSVRGSAADRRKLAEASTAG